MNNNLKSNQGVEESKSKYSPTKYFMRIRDQVRVPIQKPLNHKCNPTAPNFPGTQIEFPHNIKDAPAKGNKSCPNKGIDIESTKQKLNVLELSKSNALLRKVDN